MADDKGSAKYAFLYPPCFYCAHLRQMGRLDLTGWTCTAYPEEIPYGILKRYEKHDEVDMLFQDGPGKFESKVFEFGGVPNKITFEGDWYELKGGENAQ